MTDHMQCVCRGALTYQAPEVLTASRAWIEMGATQNVNLFAGDVWGLGQAFLELLLQQPPWDDTPSTSFASQFNAACVRAPIAAAALLLDYRDNSQRICLHMAA